MKFVVTRTSNYSMGENPPVKGAYLDKIMNVDIRCIGDPSHFCTQRDRDTWYTQGTNHRLINGEIARDLGLEDVWVVDISSIEDLMKIREECGNDIVIGTSCVDYATPEIEIYDDYRE